MSAEEHSLAKVYEQPSTGLWTALCMCGLRVSDGYRRNAEQWHSNHQQEKADEAMSCPLCDAYLGYEAHGEIMSSAVPVPIPGRDEDPLCCLIYRCPRCWGAWTRPLDPTLRAIAKPYVDLINFGRPV